MKKEKKYIILYKCKPRLKENFAKHLIDSSQKIQTFNNIGDVKNFISKNKNSIILSDAQINRSEIITEFSRLRLKNTYLILLVSNNEMKKINLKANKKGNIIYISNPPTMEELSQFLKYIFELKKLKEINAEYEKIITAYESASEFSRQELMNAYESLKAQELVSELSREELLAQEKSLKAWENISELAREEKLNLEKEKDAMDNLMSFEQKEKIFMDKVMDAWEKVMELGRNELMNLYNEIKKLQNK